MTASLDLGEIIAESRNILAERVTADPVLADIANRWPSHRFLGHCTQAVYQRQVQLLTTILIRHLDKTPDQISVHDWGCGKGHISYLLKKQGFRVTASDRNDGTDDSAYGQQTPIIDLTGIKVVPLEDPVKLPFADAAFDATTSFGVLEHVSHDLESLLEIRRVTKRGGILYITFLPYPLSWTQALARFGGNNYHDRLYWRRSVDELAKRAGFSVRSIWWGQLLPKNSVPLQLDRFLEPIDRFLCWRTPLRYLATNLEAVLVAE
jgi:SAM-dependent methyltransferase